MYVQKTVEHMKLDVKTAMTRVFNEYARKMGLLKEKDKNLEGQIFEKD